MHHRMQSMYTDNKMQMILTDYQTRPHELWSLERRNHIQTLFQNNSHAKSDEINDEEWNLCNLTLSHVVNQHLQKDLEFTDVQVNSLISAMAGQVNYHNATAESRLHPG